MTHPNTLETVTNAILAIRPGWIPETAQQVAEAAIAAMPPAAPAPINPTTVDRARLLAADYRTNPTPARAHNAAQVLGAVLDQLDAVIARTFTITDENDRLKARVNELETTASILEDSEPFSYDDCRDDCDGCHESLPTCDCHITGAEARDRIRELRDRIEAGEVERDALTARLAAQLDIPPHAELPDNAANHWTAVDQAQTSQLTATASTYATGGIVDTTNIARIGEGS